MTHPAPAHAVAHRDQIRSPLPHPVEHRGRPALLVRTLSGWWIIDALCPHRQEPLHHAVILGDEVICPHHAYRFRMPDGACSHRRCAPLDAWPVTETDEGWLVPT